MAIAANRYTAIVTGASRGIGRLIARSMAEAGYNLVLTARKNDELGTLAAELEAAGTAALPVALDLMDPESPTVLVAASEQRFGHVDVLVNNAGGDPQREFDSMSWRDNEAIIALNLLAPMRLTHLLLPGMLERGSGHIVNISSIAGRVGFPYTESYAAAKDGLIAFTRVLRNDYRKSGVSSSVIVLGAIRDAGQGQRTAEEVGLKLPSIGTSPAEAVGKAVLTALRHDRAEIVVMPGPGRLIKALADLMPALGPAMARMGGADVSVRRVIDYRKRHPIGAR